MNDIAIISHEELLKKIERKDPFFLVEALSPMSYLNGHLPGAINVPHDQVAKVAPQLLPDKNAEIVLYCGSAT